MDELKLKVLFFYRASYIRDFMRSKVYYAFGNNTIKSTFQIIKIVWKFKIIKKLLFIDTINLKACKINPFFFPIWTFERESINFNLKFNLFKK